MGASDPPFLLVNGANRGTPITLSPAAVHRFRFVGIGAANAGQAFTLRHAGVVAEWTPVAKTARVAECRSQARPAMQRLRRAKPTISNSRFPPGEYSLTFRSGDGRQGWHQRITVLILPRSARRSERSTSLERLMSAIDRENATGSVIRWCQPWRHHPSGNVTRVFAGESASSKS